jgi:hypothetical protein
MGQHNYQLNNSVGGEGSIGKEMQPGRNVWGGRFTVIWGSDWGDRKKDWGRDAALSGRR